MAILKIRDNEGVITNIAAIKGENGKSPFWYGTCTKCGETQITRKDPNGIKLERNKK